MITATVVLGLEKLKNSPYLSPYSWTTILFIERFVSPTIAISHLGVIASVKGPEDKTLHL